MSIKSIARELNISGNSVRKYMKSESLVKRNRKRRSKLDPYRCHEKSSFGHVDMTVSA
ncbi:hypothetical protein [Cuniculiplasma thermophilum]|uniref:hypothetical protein n=1 Tax=Cuniculiplasma sp. SKW3 TaxID=3400170 RepID=UPI003FD62C81